MTPRSDRRDLVRPGGEPASNRTAEDHHEHVCNRM